LRFYLSKNETLNVAAVGTEPADIPLPIGQFPDANLPALQPGAGLRYDLVRTVGSNGAPLDLRLVAPLGRTVASYFVLAHMDYSDPLADKLPISKDVTFGRINGIKLNKGSVSLTEASGPAHSQTFTVVLQGRPAADVKIKLTLSDAQIGIDKPELTFTRQNWQTPQLITVTATDDQIHEALPTTTLITIGPSESTDASWDGMPGGSVAATVTDNDP
jgi:hypothetical protein